LGSAFQGFGFQGLGFIVLGGLKTLALRRDLSMSKDMRDLSRANVRVAAKVSSIQYQSNQTGRNKSASSVIIVCSLPAGWSCKPLGASIHHSDLQVGKSGGIFMRPKPMSSHTFRRLQQR